MDQKKVKTEGTYEEMSNFANVDESTIEEAIQVVEKAADMEIEVPEEK